MRFEQDFGMMTKKNDFPVSNRDFTQAAAWCESDGAFAYDMPVLRLETVYLARKAKLGREAVWAMGRDVAVLWFEISEESFVTTVLNPDWGIYRIPVRTSEPLRVNGIKCSSDKVFIWSRTDEYVGYGRNRESLTIGYRKSRLCCALSALVGKQIPVSDLPSGIHSISSTDRQQISALARSCLDEAARQPKFKKKAPFSLTEFQERQIIRAIATDFFKNNRLEAPNASVGSAAKETVDRANAAFDGSQKPPSISALCQHCGVGLTRLNECFLQVYGVSPARYILEKRLSMARERFLDLSNPPQSVKEVALDLGFEGTGRFAKYYKRSYRELPSETFKRAKKMPSDPFFNSMQTKGTAR